MAQGALAQLNVRMDRGVKAAGDSVLLEAGVSSAELIRGLWAKVARGVTDLRQVQEVLFGQAPIAAEAQKTNLAGQTAWSSEQRELRMDALSENAAEKLKAIERGRSLYAEALEDLGISRDEGAFSYGQRNAAERSDADLYAEALIERMRERQL